MIEKLREGMDIMSLIPDNETIVEELKAIDWIVKILEEQNHTELSPALAGATYLLTRMKERGLLTFVEKDQVIFR